MEQFTIKDPDHGGGVTGHIETMPESEGFIVSKIEEYTKEIIEAKKKLEEYLVFARRGALNQEDLPAAREVVNKIESIVFNKKKEIRPTIDSFLEANRDGKYNDIEVKWDAYNDAEDGAGDLCVEMHEYLLN